MVIPFVLLDTQGLPRSFSDCQGRPLVVSFFKSTCPTCRLLFPYLERLHRRYVGRGLTVWGISQDTLDEALAFAAEEGITFPILLDTEWNVSNSYSIKTVPTTFLFGKEGRAAFTSFGFRKQDLNDIARAVAERIGRKPMVLAPSDDGNPPFRPG